MRQTLERPKEDDFTLEAALKHRDLGTFESWLDAFLRGPGNNVPLADGLRLAQRWWVGPKEIPLTELVYKCGPGLEFHEDEAHWKSRIGELAIKINEGLRVPPLIAEFKDGRLMLADGNHRCGALQSTGATKYWTAIWFNSELEWASFARGW